MKTIFFLLSILFPLVWSHGLMVKPPQRGALDTENDLHRGFDDDAPNDFFAHFPAGGIGPDGGLRSLIRAAQPEGWMPFEPLNPNFKWRVGVCGDELGKTQDHMRGGKYYYDAKIATTYQKGQDIEIEMNIVAHHNGFVEMHLCDVERCGGEISENCFKQGHCVQLKRAPNPSCDSRRDKRCAPIDPNYPGRWPFPCSTVPENTPEMFGGNKMLYSLPDNLECEHCVLHWFWSSANDCNPPGVVEFFEGPHGPLEWGSCRGQAGAIGGYTKVQGPCTSKLFPEEYYQCADIRILGSGRSSDDRSLDPSSQPTNTPEPTKPTATPIVTPTPEPSKVENDPGALFTYFALFADGKEVGSLADGARLDISSYSKVTIEAVTSRDAEGDVTFFINGEKVSTESTRPYFAFGNVKDVHNYWGNPIVNTPFEIKAEADGEVLQAIIELVQS